MDPAVGVVLGALIGAGGTVITSLSAARTARVTVQAQGEVQKNQWLGVRPGTDRGTLGEGSLRGRTHVSGTVPADLHADAEELMTRLTAAVDSREWLDGYLFAAGIVQIVEDRLQGTSWPVRRLVKHLGGGGGAGTAVHWAGRGLDVVTEAYLSVPPVRRLHSWGRGLARTTDTLASLVLGGDDGQAADAAENIGADAAENACEEAVRVGVREAARTFDGRLLDGSLLRPPASFCSFDQHPQDLVELARRFRAEHADRERPLLVVGVRTSGSCLAPLLGAALRRLGHRRVTTGTTRPGLVLLPGRTADVEEVRSGGGLVLVVDDPPASGASLAAVAARAEREGFPAEAVVPVFATFDDGGSLPPSLHRYRSVVLPGPDWHVHRRLSADALRAVLPDLLPPECRLLGVEVGTPGALSRKAHLAVPLAVLVDAPATGRTLLPLVAEWSGLGYLGRRPAVLAQALTDLVPTVHGFADGVLLRDRLPGENRPRPEVPPADVARYVAARQERLAVPEDRSLRLAGREPVWEMAARVLAPVFGRAHVVLRPALLHPLVRSLLTAEQPCLVDGRTSPGLWAADARGGWAKTDFSEGAFSNLNLASYDAAWDLAGAADLGDDGDGWNGGDSRDDGSSEEQLLADYARLTGRRISPARWCLLRIVQARRLDRPADTRRAQARAVQRFLAGAYLADLEGDPEGPWCVLDVDGTLESDVMGFPASSPQGALALRALRAHGYRTAVATGRSLPEVQDRCAAYRLAGGVAEYGAVCFDASTGSTQVVLPPERQRAEDGGLRARLADLPSVRVDPFSRWCVRASVHHGGHRTGLDTRTVAALLDEDGLRALFEVVPGDAQTDFVPRGTDKTAGVAALLARFGDDASTAPVLAVGDGVADIALLRQARIGTAPGNAAPEVVAAGIPVVRRSYQAGLADIVGQLIGHRPGGCPLCRPPQHSPDTRALLALLAVPEAGRAGLPDRIARLALADLGLARHGSSANGENARRPNSAHA